MAISLKDYDKTLFLGVYISRQTYPDGKKYIGRFQYNHKKYLKVLGYSIKNNMTPTKANDAFLTFKGEIVSDKDSEAVSRYESEQKTQHKDKKTSETVEKYAKILGSHKKVERALLRRLQKEQIAPYQIELIKMQNYLDSNHKKVMVLFEGRDASGKGGAIRTLTRFMNSKHYRVVALGKPSDAERTQWFFQRYVAHFPKAGEIIFFDRSWYNRAIVEPVFGFCTKEEYESFFQDVKKFEQSIVRSNTKLIKIYFSVSKDMQAQRFARRSNDPLRQWKLSEVDLQAQSLWDVFSEKKYKMLRDAEIKEAPWHVIRSDDKFLARLETIKVILGNVDYPNKNLKLDYNANRDVVFNAEEVKQQMKQETPKSR